MNFFEAMKELEKGNKVRCSNWKDEIYLYKENKKICFSEAGFLKSLNMYDLNFGTWEIYKEAILDKTEKEYLSNVIKPFKNRVCYIVKYKNICSYKEEYIQICVKSDIRMAEYISLPAFISGSMYKNMKVEHKYSLKELGLDE